MLRALLYLLFFCSSFSVAAQSPKDSHVPPTVVRAEEGVLRKLLRFTKDSLDDGLWLLDTLTRESGFGEAYKSTLAYPGALVTTVKRKLLSAANGKGQFETTWEATLVKVDTANWEAFEDLMESQATLVRSVLRQQKDSARRWRSGADSSLTRTWSLGAGATLTLYASYYKSFPDRVTLSVSCRKPVPFDKSKAVAYGFSRFGAAAELTATRSGIAVNFATFAKFLLDQGLTPKEATDTAQRLFLAIADRDMPSAFDILMKLDEDMLRPLTSLLSSQQKEQVRTMAQNVVDDWTRKYGPPPPPSPKLATTTNAPSNPCAENISRQRKYPLNAAVSYGGEDFILQHYDCYSNTYRVAARRFVPARKSALMDNGTRNHYQIEYLHFDPENTEKIFGKATRTLSLCFSCGGSGLQSYTREYSRTEYGIYKKYEYSGRYNVVEACSSCRGTGLSK